MRGAEFLRGEFTRIGGYKLVAMIAGGLVATFASWALVNRFGVAGYALYTLLATLLIMLPFADLGLGAAVVNLTADFSAGRLTTANYEFAYHKIRRILIGVGGIICAVSVTLYSTTGFAFIVGPDLSSRTTDAAVAAVLITIAVSLPFGAGARILQGAGRTDLMTKITLLNPATQFGLLIAALACGLEYPYVALAPAVAFLATTVFTDHASRRIINANIGIFASYKKRERRVGGSAVQNLWKTSVAFLVMSTGMLLIFQMQRIIVVHLAGPIQLAEFSLIAQYLIPILALIVAVSQALWPRFRSSKDGPTPEAFARTVRLFAYCGILAGVLLSALVLGVSSLLLNGEVETSWASMLGAALYLFAMSVFQPCSMLLTMTDGLRVQAALTVVASGMSILVSLLVTPTLGAAGGLLAAGASVLLLQAIPLLVLSRRYVAYQKTLSGVFQERL
ncbi:hypothetical protein HQ602_14205 [Rhodococcus kroppenstedtii]|uniref:hypothetical protein n=1 Tax=Rhodococcoides kroppenstedtii TaxID=293050 RepID=UPI001C9A4F8E|nr:hypothetical protein [Rhodococcus kroppenstedtii]MBY6437536.1 hypothetical protein [Rhodococcus kroppenstedtii]